MHKDEIENHFNVFDYFARSLHLKRPILLLKTHFVQRVLHLPLDLMDPIPAYFQKKVKLQIKLLRN